MKGIDTTRIDQIGIVVRDLDEKVKAWSALLGSEPTLYVTTQGYEQAGTLYNGEPTEAKLRVAVFQVGDMELELMEPIDGPGVWSEYLEERGDCLHHIGFKSDDLQAGIDALAEQDIPVVQRAEYPVGYYAYFRSEPQLGTIIELNHMKGIPWPSST